MIWRKLADWCVPAGAFPQWLTDVDDPDLFGGRWVPGIEARHLLARMTMATEFDTNIPTDAPTRTFVRLCSCMHTRDQHDPESSYHCRVCPCEAFAPPG